jgi:hypothetical protein
MYPNTVLDITVAPKRNSFHWTPGTTTWGEVLAWVERPASRKECGGYVFGVLRKTMVEHKKGDPSTADLGYHRTKAAVVTRSAITLDVDHNPISLADMAVKVEQMLGCAALIHTTFSSSPDDLRYRIIIPLDRPVKPDEYRTLVGLIMDKLGRQQFDEGSLEPERFMYLPAAQKEGWFDSHGN